VASEASCHLPGCGSENWSLCHCIDERFDQAQLSCDRQ
jgi:hypothetical protein